MNQTIDKIAAQNPFPESTYRLQFHKGFTFVDATNIVPYLAKLGVSHLYASPYLKARPGSTHGYDVIDHCSLNPEVGTDEQFDAWLAAMKQHGLFHVLDIVPNHVGVGTNDNKWWNDVLENGPASRYGKYFDIAWRGSPRPELHDKVLLPVLGDPYATVLEQGQLKLIFRAAEGGFHVQYFDREFPLSPRSYSRLLNSAVDEFAQRSAREDADAKELQNIIESAGRLPDRSGLEPAEIEERHRQKENIKTRLARVSETSERVRSLIAKSLASINGTPGAAKSFDQLDELLNQQYYRLSFWRVASDEINYRRFFDINDLAALSMERDEVFHATHPFILSLVADGKVAGLRADHPDGLYDPEKYFAQLQRAFVEEFAKRHGGLPAHEIDELAKRRLLYAVAEKILAVDEPLPPDWAVHGTSGYDFLNMVNGLFIDPAAEKPFNTLYQDLTGEGDSIDDLIYRNKRLILQISLASELQMLAHQLDRIAQCDRRSRDFTLRALRSALRELIACFPVYRSYVSTPTVRPFDKVNIDQAIERAAQRNAKIDRSVFDFIRDVLLQKSPGRCDSDDALQGERLRFAGKFQQLTSPVTAKGIEDTTFYIYNRFISLNEVGGDLAQFGVGVAKLHEYNAMRQREWPFSMSALSTHDTKRSEDVRARLNALSERPAEWDVHVRRWYEINTAHRGSVNGSPAPTANDEYLLYQTLLGAWPLEMDDELASSFAERVQAYMTKAIREAKINSSWTAPNKPYEAAVSTFVSTIMHREAGGEFLEDFLPLKDRIARAGLLNSLAQTLLRITSPGVPDTYQGCELWDFSLVDPDNRRPVDYASRARLLEAFSLASSNREQLVRDLTTSPIDGRIKLLVTTEALRARRDYSGLFTKGEYLPLSFTGPCENQLFGFLRRQGRQEAVVVVPRLASSMLKDDTTLQFEPDAWHGTKVQLPAGLAKRWKNVFTGEISDAGELLDVTPLLLKFPAALLLSV